MKRLALFFKEVNILWTDFHSHVLPGIDDGSKSVEMSIKMLEGLKKQGVSQVCATPHFYMHREETVESFLEKRKGSFEKLKEANYKKYVDEIFLGAEVSIEHDLEHLDVRPLCLGNSNLILLEFPYREYESWMIQLVENIMYSYDLIPVFAHLERYIRVFSKSTIEEILKINNAVIQINADSFDDRQVQKLLGFLTDINIPVLIGSDTHNTTTRCPSYDQALKVMNKVTKKKLKSHITKCVDYYEKLL